MYKLTNRNHYYNSNGMNNDPARTRQRGYHRENDAGISGRIYRPGYDTSREYNKGDAYHYDNDSDIYESEFINDHDDINYNNRSYRRNRYRNDDNFFHQVGRKIRHAWDNLRHHDDPDAYYNDDELEARRQRTQYYSDNDFDSVYNAEDENSYSGYQRRKSPYDYQDEFDQNFDDFEWDRNYNSVNVHDYNDYDRGRDEFDYQRRRNLRRHRSKFSMDL